jgi:exopolyphosphatase/guanosine-5'-triphosphate,3'-diphosphate pyrophosphatase
MPQQEPRRVAVIDLGSNTARLIVMQATLGHAYRLADEIREVVRLREGMVDGALSEDAIERALLTLRLFERFCDTTGVDIIIPTATSAVREATNGPQFVQRVQREIGLTLQVLDGEREAYYGAIGALNEISMERGHAAGCVGAHRAFRAQRPHQAC